jgi:predicted porin
MPIWFNTRNFPKTEVGSGKTRAPIQTLENLEMKKTLVALAALAATSAFAQSSVVFSGNVDVAWRNQDITSGTGTNLFKTGGISEGTNLPNMINISATEDIGGGAKAGVVVENGLNITNGNLFSTRAAAGGPQLPAGGSTSAELPTASYSTATNRQSYVRYSAGFGEIRAGFQYTNLYELSTRSGYMVGAEQYGSLLHTIGNASFGGTRANGITYIAPKMGNVTLSVQYGAGSGRQQAETDTAAGANGYTKNNADRVGLMAKYVAGPVSAAFAHTKYDVNQVAGSTTAVLNEFGATSATAASSSEYKGTLNQLGASYEMGSFKLAGTYSTGEKDVAGGVTSDVKYKSQQIGGVYTSGNAKFFALTGSGEVKTNGAMTNDISQSQYGVRYSLSKRTTAYVMAGTTKDKAQTLVTGTAKGSFNAIGLSHSY